MQVPQIKVARPKREPSRLGRLIFGLGLVTIGLMAIVDLMLDASVPFENYVTAALIVVGAGLVIGAWFGRARGFIFLGIILSLMLPIAADEHDRERSGRPGTVTWVPLTTQEISDSYEHRFGEATLDLSNVDFTGHDVGRRRRDQLRRAEDHPAGRTWMSSWTRTSASATPPYSTTTSAAPA